MIFRRLEHANKTLLKKINNKTLTRDLPKFKLHCQFCNASKMKKLVHLSHKTKNMISTK